jgi:DNA binding domain, excisionase family
MNEDNLDSRSDTEQAQEETGLEAHISTSEFGEAVGIHTNTVRKWCKEGKIKSKKLPNGQRRIPKSQVDQVLEEA